MRILFFFLVAAWVLLFESTAHGYAKPLEIESAHRARARVCEIALDQNLILSLYRIREKSDTLEKCTSTLGVTGYTLDREASQGAGSGGAIASASYYAKARYYDAGNAAFTSEDPWAGDTQHPMSFNPYLYAYANPNAYVDPTGKIGVFSDGTWNDRDNPYLVADGAQTNVSKLRDLYEGKRFYQKGVGTDWYTKHLCGLIGCGFNARVNAAYEAIKDVYNDPDATDEQKQIDIFGFSRGAAISRALVNKLIEEGIPVTTRTQKWVDNYNGGKWVWEETIEHVKPKIRYVGLFDTVPALGDPTDPSSVYETISVGYSQALDFSKIGTVRQTVAANEARYAFDLMSIKNHPNQQLPENAREEYFLGRHSDNGGGYGRSEGGSSLAVYPLAYQYIEARKVGVPLRNNEHLNTVLSELRRNFVQANAGRQDSRTTLERWSDRQQRTVYYGNARYQEELTFDEMMLRAYKFARSVQGSVIESGSGDPQIKLESKP